MAIHALFPTLLYQTALAKPASRRVGQTLADECRALAASDAAGRRWSARHYLGGYTSYGSLHRLHPRSSAFAGLSPRLGPHSRAFARSFHDHPARRSPPTADFW